MTFKVTLLLLCFRALFLRSLVCPFLERELEDSQELTRYYEHQQFRIADCGDTFFFGSFPFRFLLRFPFFLSSPLRKGKRASQTMKPCVSKSPVRLEGNFNYSRTFSYLDVRRPGIRHRAMFLTLGVFAARKS